MLFHWISVHKFTSRDKIYIYFFAVLWKGLIIFHQVFRPLDSTVDGSARDYLKLPRSVIVQSTELTRISGL